MKVNGGATEAMKPLLGNYYQYDGTPILKAMYREMKECIYVEKDEGETKGVYCLDLERKSEKERVRKSEKERRKVNCEKGKGVNFVRGK
ncbi:hypothetical protein AgCh_023805 [Apium graveolens]